MTDAKTTAKDPTCGMTVDTAKAVKADRDGKTYHFCSEGCKEKFIKEPSTTR